MIMGPTSYMRHALGWIRDIAFHLAWPGIAYVRELRAQRAQALSRTEAGLCDMCGNVPVASGARCEACWLDMQM